MVSTHFHGELGNNLFQLASLLSLKDCLNVDYEITQNRDCWLTKDRPLEIEKLFEHKFNFVESYTQQYEEYLHTDCINQNLNEYTFAFKNIPKKDGIITKGYFQSEKYFLPIRDKIVGEYFQFNKNVVNYIDTKYNKYLKNSLAIHFRAGGDRPNLFDIFPLLNNDYYDKAIDIVLSKNNIENVLVFSDNISLPKKIMGNRYTFIEGESNIVDLTFMSMCNHNIIANSTFSWWSAYLNKNTNKTVVAPKTNWFGGSLLKLDTSDLFPKEWLLI